MTCDADETFLHGISSKRIHQETDNVSIRPFSMIVSRRGCLQAGCNQCEFVGNEREQSVRLVGDESEQRNAMFASRGADVCKLLVRHEVA